MNARGWKGPRKGPCTSGEAMTMTAIVCGVQPEEVAAFVVIGVINCEDCGEPHNLILNQNVTATTAIRILGLATSQLMEEL